jgi:hypothetical protein
MSEISERLQKRRYFVVGMIAATLVSFSFWGLISLFYSGRPQIDYSWTCLFVIYLTPVHLILLVIASILFRVIWFRTNRKKREGFIFAEAIAVLLDVGAIYGGVQGGGDTILLLALVLFALALILLLVLRYSR